MQSALVELWLKWGRILGETSSQYTVTTSIKSFGLCEKSADWIFQKFRLQRNSFWEAYKKIVLYLFEIPHKSPQYLLCSNDKLNLTIPPFADTFTFIFPFPFKCTRITHSKCDLDFIPNVWFRLMFYKTSFVRVFPVSDISQSIIHFTDSYQYWECGPLQHSHKLAPGLFVFWKLNIGV